MTNEMETFVPSCLRAFVVRRGRAMNAILR